MSRTRRSSKRKASAELLSDDRQQLLLADHHSPVLQHAESNISSSSSVSVASSATMSKRTARAKDVSTHRSSAASVTPISHTNLHVADQLVTVEPMPFFSAAPSLTTSPAAASSSSVASTSFSASSIEEWRTFLQTNGYIFLHDVLPRELVLQVRNLLLTTLESRGLIHPLLASSDEHGDNVASERKARLESRPARAIDPKASPNFLTDLPLQQTPKVQQLLEHPRLSQLIHSLIQPDTKLETTDGSSNERRCSSHLWTSNYKWLRGVGQGCCTGFHLDRVYMSSKAERERLGNDRVPAPLYSCWLPIGDVSMEQGCLVISPGSHVNAQFERLRTEYGASNVGTHNGTTSGWIQIKEFTDQPVKWVSSAAPAGSIVLLDLSVLHGTSVNTSDEYRLSCDTRWTTAPCHHSRTAVNDGASDLKRSCGKGCDKEPPATIRFKRVDY